MKSVRLHLTLIPMTLALFGANAAQAFVGHEHTGIADDGAAVGVQRVREMCSKDKALCNADLLKLPMSTPGDGRWITCGRDVSNKDDCSVLATNNLLMLWIGPDAKTGSWGSFGQLAEVAADHAEDVDTLARMTPKNWNGNVAAAEADGIVGNTASGTADYVKLAQENSSHFSRDAVIAYTKCHEHALALAKVAGESAAVGAAAPFMHLAMFWEAFAAHFLSDLFAPGHLIVDDRSVSVEWAWGVGKWTPMGLKRTWTYDKSRHDLGNKAGLLLNSFTDTERLKPHPWVAYGDDNLGKSYAHFKHARDAVATSVASVFAQYMMGASNRGNLSRGVAYAALNHVPAAIDETQYIKGMPEQKVCNAYDNGKTFCRLPVYDEIKRVLAD